MTGLIEAPSSRDVYDSLLDERRSDDHIHLLSKTLGIQRKDVPILVLAYRHYDREPVVLTNDSDFADFSPSEYNLSKIDIEHTT